MSHKCEDLPHWRQNCGIHCHDLKKITIDDNYVTLHDYTHNKFFDL